VAAEATDLDAARIGMVTQHFQGARTKALCDQCMHKMTAPEFGQLPLPILELHDPQAVAARLREWFVAKATSPEVRDGVARMLMRAGDQTVARPLWGWVQGLAEADDRHAATLEFGACGGKEVVQLLGEKVPKEPPAQRADAVVPLAGLVAAFAGDTRMASGLLGELLPLANEDFAAAWRALAGPLLAGDAASAIRGYLAIRPLSRGSLPGVGAFRDVAVPYLMQARAQREHGLYLWATGELALIGMPAARDEIDGAVARRMYRWIDSLDPRVLVGRGSAEGVVKVLPLLPGNCCSYTVLASRLEDAFEVDAFPPEQALKPRAQMVADRWWQIGDRWRWSWLAGKLIAAPK
jgi:hypothetical protein